MNKARLGTGRGVFFNRFGKQVLHGNVDFAPLLCIWLIILEKLLRKPIFCNLIPIDPCQAQHIKITIK